MKSKLPATLLRLALLSTLSHQSSTLYAQGTAFTYQGRLNDGANPASGNYEILFRPFDVLTGGSQLTIPNIRPVIVSNGLFTTTMDFGSAIFEGGPVFLQLEVRTNTAATFAVLASRQQLTPTPYAIFAVGAGAAGITGTIPASALGNAWLLSGNSNTVSGQFLGTTDDQPFDIRVNNVRVMRYRLATDAEGIYSNAPNVIGGSSVNSATTTIVGATIAGGGGNLSFDGSSVNNKVTANFGTVSGGENNAAGGDYATIGGGRNNTAKDQDGTVCGGEDNTASGFAASVCGGFDNTASGDYSMVPGGQYNVAAGGFSFAGGYSAQANHEGSFVWSGNNFYPFASTTANQFRVRAIGGVAFVTAIDGSGNATAGVHLLSGDTAWSSISDRNAKKNFQPVNGEAVLEKLAAMPVLQWNYKWEADTSTPHLGPMAQDFKAAFYPGRDDKSISTLEFDGVELAAIQGLNQKLEQKETEIMELKQKNESFEKRLDALEKMIRDQKPN
jgi:hypothetical protein